MPVCIAGMARSGTSLCTRTLNLCGLSLGDEADLLPPGPDNPDGFWENTRFVEINETLLSMFGGAWDCPPIIPLEDDSEPFARLHAKARTTLESFAGREPWGWKDPRNSLTLPFWRQYFPEMKVVICLRNPLEVAQSLYRRSWYSSELSLNLWYVYNQRLRGAIPPEQRIVTHYDAYFADPEAELRRVLDFLGMPAGENLIAQACAAISGGLRHHQFTMQHLHDVNVTPAVLDLYATMCREAGDVAGDLAHVMNGPAESIMPSPARGAEREAGRDPLPGDRQLGLAVAGVGRLDRAALDVIVLRDEVRELNTVVSAARDVQEQLRTRAEALEQQLAILQEEHGRRGAYIDTLEEQRGADKAVDAELRSYARDLEKTLTAAQADHRELHRYAQTLEGQLRAAAEEQQQLRTYARILEEQCDTARAYLQDVATAIQALEAALAAARRDHEQLGTYATALEQQIAAAHADQQQSAEYTRGLERQLATAYDDHAKLDAWAKTLIERIELLEAAGREGAACIADLERQLTTLRDERQRPDALEQASTASRLAQLRTHLAILLRRFNRTEA